MNFEEQIADLSKLAAIEGYTHVSGDHFKVPLISHVIGDLWMGGCLHGVRLPDDFRTVVSLYNQERYALGPDTRRHDFIMYDIDEEPNAMQVEGAAEFVLAKSTEGKTLVHCQAGLNRSGLVTALTLMKLGWGASKAIAHLRETRSPAVLCNGAFERWLLSYEEGAE